MLISFSVYKNQQPDWGPIVGGPGPPARRKTKMGLGMFLHDTLVGRENDLSKLEDEGGILFISAVMIGLGGIVCITTALAWIQIGWIALLFGAIEFAIMFRLTCNFVCDIHNAHKPPTDSKTGD